MRFKGLLQHKPFCDSMKCVSQTFFSGLLFKHEEFKALCFCFVTFKHFCLGEENIKYAFFSSFNKVIHFSSCTYKNLFCSFHGSVSKVLLKGRS